MKSFTTVAKLIEAYTADFNSRCQHTDEHFTAEEIERYHVTTMHRLALSRKHGIDITAVQTTVIRGFGYVAA